MSLWKQLIEDIWGTSPSEPPARGNARRPAARTMKSAARSETVEDAAHDTIRDFSPPDDADAQSAPSAPIPERPAAARGGNARTRDAANQPAEERPPGPALVVGAALGGLSLLIAVITMGASVVSAKQRLLEPEAEKPNIAIAQQAEVGYCTKDFKTVLERVLHSCGLAQETERRGCKPSDIKTFAAISDADFNSLFLPLQERGGVLMFDDGSDELDATGKKLLEERWFDRKGARYFFVVARASKTGTPEKNRALSHRRANSVLFYLKEISGESEAELNQKVGLLWLGNEYAQLPQEYCAWPRSRGDARCDEEAINRSAFVSWVDCRL